MGDCGWPGCSSGGSHSPSSPRGDNLMEKKDHAKVDGNYMQDGNQRAVRTTAAREDSSNNIIDVGVVFSSSLENDLSPSSLGTGGDCSNDTTRGTGSQSQSLFQSIRTSRQLKLVVVFLALFIDYFLLTVVVPILPEYLENEDENEPKSHVQDNSDIYIGLLFAAKPIVQLICNPLVGAITDKNVVNSQVLLMAGFLIMIGSTLGFGFAQTYWLLLVARASQGIGSSLAAVAGFAMLATYYVDNEERGKAMSIAYLGVSMGVLLGPPIGGLLYEWFGKSVPFFALAVFISVVFVLLLIVIDFSKPNAESEKGKEEEEEEVVKGGLIQLLKDPYVLIVAGAMLIACSSISLLEPTLPVWMLRVMPETAKWQLGVVFLPCSGAYLIATPLMGYLGTRFGRWKMSLIGIILICGACFVIPFCESFYELLPPMAVVGFGIGMTDAPLLPELGRIVDLRHSEGMYGNAYAIGDMAMSLGSIIGPLCGGITVQAFSFKATVWAIAIVCVMYSPVIAVLKRLDSYDPSKQEFKGKRSSRKPSFASTRKSTDSESLIDEVTPLGGRSGGEGLE